MTGITMLHMLAHLLFVVFPCLVSGQTMPGLGHLFAMRNNPTEVQVVYYAQERALSDPDRLINEFPVAPGTKYLDNAQSDAYQTMFTNSSLWAAPSPLPQATLLHTIAVDANSDDIQLLGDGTNYYFSNHTHMLKGPLDGSAPPVAFAEVPAETSFALDPVTQRILFYNSSLPGLVTMNTDGGGRFELESDFGMPFLSIEFFNKTIFVSGYAGNPNVIWSNDFENNHPMTWGGVWSPMYNSNPECMPGAATGYLRVDPYTHMLFNLIPCPEQAGDWLLACIPLNDVGIDSEIVGYLPEEALSTFGTSFAVWDGIVFYSNPNASTLNSFWSGEPTDEGTAAMCVFQSPHNITHQALSVNLSFVHPSGCEGGQCGLQEEEEEDLGGPLLNMNGYITSENGSTPVQGSLVAFYFILSNDGTAAASNVVVGVSFNGLELNHTEVTIGSYDTASDEWTLPSLATGTGETLSMVARITQTGFCDVLASTGSGSGGHRLYFYPPTIDVDLALQNVTTPKYRPPVGEEAHILLSLHNSGPRNATNIAVMVEWGPGFSSRGASPYNDTNFVQTDKGNWSLHCLDVDAEVFLDAWAVVQSKSNDSNQWSMSASITAYDQTDTNISNNYLHTLLLLPPSSAESTTTFLTETTTVVAMTVTCGVLVGAVVFYTQTKVGKSCVTKVKNKLCSRESRDYLKRKIRRKATETMFKKLRDKLLENRKKSDRVLWGELEKRLRKEQTTVEDVGETADWDYILRNELKFKRRLDVGRLKTMIKEYFVLQNSTSADKTVESGELTRVDSEIASFTHPSHHNLLATQENTRSSEVELCEVQVEREGTIDEAALERSILRVFLQHSPSQCLISDQGASESRAAEAVRALDPEDPFLVVDLHSLVQLFAAWKHRSPRVEPVFDLAHFSDLTQESALVPFLVGLHQLGCSFACHTLAHLRVAASLQLDGAHVILDCSWPTLPHLRLLEKLPGCAVVCRLVQQNLRVKRVASKALVVQWIDTTKAVDFTHVDGFAGDVTKIAKLAGGSSLDEPPQLVFLGGSEAKMDETQALLERWPRARFLCDATDILARCVVLAAPRALVEAGECAPSSGTAMAGEMEWVYRTPAEGSAETDVVVVHSCHDA